MANATLCFWSFLLAAMDTKTALLLPLFCKETYFFFSTQRQKKLQKNVKIKSSDHVLKALCHIKLNILAKISIHVSYVERTIFVFPNACRLSHTRLCYHPLKAWRINDLERVSSVSTHVFWQVNVNVSLRGVNMLHTKLCNIFSDKRHTKKRKNAQHTV